LSSFLWWLHSEASYTFNGDAPIAGLTPNELDVLKLGKLVENEQTRSSTTQSDPLGQRKQELREGHRKQRRKEFSDLGFQ